MTPYLKREPVSTAKNKNCYYCDVPLRNTSGNGIHYPATRTKDHILPRCNGTLPYISTSTFIGPTEYFDTIGTTRPCCADCNLFRAQLDHCTGVMMMMIIEGRERDIDKREAAALLNMWSFRACRVGRKARIPKGVPLTSKRERRAILLAQIAQQKKEKAQRERALKKALNSRARKAIRDAIDETVGRTAGYEHVGLYGALEAA